MPNINSIALDRAAEVDVVVPESQLSELIAKNAGRAKNKQTALALIALGIRNPLRAMRVAGTLERFMSRHVSQTSYTLALEGPATLRVSANTPQTNLRDDELACSVVIG